jgi:hypothetical protein
MCFFKDLQVAMVVFVRVVALASKDHSSETANQTG